MSKKVKKARVKAQQKARESQRRMDTLRKAISGGSLLFPTAQEFIDELQLYRREPLTNTDRERQRPDGQLWWTRTRPSLNTWQSMAVTPETETPWYLRRESCKRFRHVKPFRVAHDTSRSARREGLWPYNPDGSANAAYVRKVECVDLPRSISLSSIRDRHDLYFGGPYFAQFLRWPQSYPSP